MKEGEKKGRKNEGRKERKKGGSEGGVKEGREEGGEEGRKGGRGGGRKERREGQAFPPVHYFLVFFQLHLVFPSKMSTLQKGTCFPTNCVLLAFGHQLLPH